MFVVRGTEELMQGTGTPMELLRGTDPHGFLMHGTDPRGTRNKEHVESVEH